MTTDEKSGSTCPEWYSPDEVLREEANRIHTGQKPRGLRMVPKAPPGGAAPAAPDKGGETADAAARDKAPEMVARDAPWEDIPKGVEGMALRRALYDRYSTALCLSGGGVRSASFNVGVIEALAVHPRPDSDKKRGDAQAADHEASFLSQFDYLSTVSGGGYIGSWLSAWVAREGYAKVWPRLVGRRNKPEKEPSQIVWLRSYSSFLTPRKGLLSADTWAAIALVIRNLVLNWLIIISVLCLALLAIKGVAIGAHWVPRTLITTLSWHGTLAAVLMLLALGYALANRASSNPGVWENVDGVWRLIDRKQRKAPTIDTQRDESSRIGAGSNEPKFMWLCLAPALLAAFVISLALSVSYFILETYPLVDTIWWVIKFSVPAYGAAWLLARLRIAFHDPANKPPKRGFVYWLLDLLAWLLAGLVYGVIIAVGAHVLAQVFDADAIQNMIDRVCAASNLCISLQTVATALLLIGGLPWIVIAQATGEMIFVGVTNWEPDSDADREWFGRSTGWFTLAAVVWFFMMILVILGPPLLALLFSEFSWAKYGTVILGGLSAAASTLLGGSGKTSATNQAPEKAPWWVKLVLPVSTIVFLILLVIAVSAAIDWLLFGHMLVESPLLGAESGDYAQDWRWFWIAVLVVGLVAIAASAFVNINRFSIHSLYRNRLIRGYLGASNPDRAPNPFTGFDEDDNIRMARLWPAKAKKGETAEVPRPWRPFHIVNIALNVVNSKRLAWQERKAESFTVSPLHCGSAGNDLGYRRTSQYGDAKNGGITLGTALAISGAAASPNMGYHSSPLVTLLLALFNVRLGWWLGNPGTPGDHTYTKDGPIWAIVPFLTEMFGQTTDESRFVYLSDGGHFENLGLYEMIRRRCRCIVVSDAGQDPNYDFTDLGNAVRKIAIDLGVYITFSELREIKARSKDNTVIKGAYYAVGEIDYKTAPERSPAPGAGAAETRQAEADRQGVKNGYILYIKPSYHGNESAGIVSYAAANAAFPHEPTFELFYGESQFESYRTLGFEIVDSVFREAKDKAAEILNDKGRTWDPTVTKICDLIAALAPVTK